MPYIKYEDRGKYISLLAELKSLPCPTVGELNYMITNICKIYLEKKGEKYQSYNDLFGVLSCVEKELYRRKVAKYEDEKIKLNGEVF